MNDKRNALNACALIPVYNHTAVVRETVIALLAEDLPVVLVDDGSEQNCKALLASIAQEFEHVTLHIRQQNGGKGAAIKDGLATAKTLGFSHAVQIDADGQHNINDVKRFLAAATTAPQALVCGFPQYDTSIPKLRYYGRYATHIWVWINTLSFNIKDSMCGFRVYPVNTSHALICSSNIGNRMDFDGEFIVRWYWRALPMVQMPTKVIYPENGVSHFRLWEDNVLISWMHARLFFGMLLRSPVLLARKLKGG